ncbi:MAG: hypothetical protein ACOYPS_00420 [Phycisphaerales bacterium]|jgi:hypothetical protein
MTPPRDTATVLLRHELPDGSWHHDWMIDPGDDRPLITFRTMVLIPEVDRFEAERLGDHRRVYLSYEGPVSGGRGEVTRVAEGAARLIEVSSRSLIVDVAFAGRQWVRWEGSGSEAAWVFCRG